MSLIPPKLAMINDIAGFGRCSTAVSFPVISVLGVQVCPVPTSILSNHLGFPVCHFTDYTPDMRAYLKAWQDLHLKFDGLYCGFLGSPAQADIVTEFLDTFLPPFFLLDPVMGDHGRKYRSVTDAHCESLRSLSKRASVLTPNLTEACLLTGTPYHEGIWSEDALYTLCLALSDFCPGSIVITGLSDGTTFQNVIWEDKKIITRTFPKTGSARPGTGDLFASIVAAKLLQGTFLQTAVDTAAGFIGLCIKESDAAGVPIQEGVIFEAFLRELL